MNEQYVTKQKERNKSLPLGGNVVNLSKTLSGINQVTFFNHPPMSS